MFRVRVGGLKVPLSDPGQQLRRWTGIVEKTFYFVLTLRKDKNPQIFFHIRLYCFCSTWFVVCVNERNLRLDVGA